MRARLRRGWWWVFSVLIAGPALVLAALGLRAISADRSERERQLQDQQTQTARLADAAIANTIEHTTALLDRIDSEGLARPDPVSAKDIDFPVFLIDRKGVISFPWHRVYFGPIGLRPEFLERAGQLSPAASQLIWDAQAMEAQHRTGDAIARYRQAIDNSALKDWARLALDRLEEQPEEIARIRRLADPQRAQSQAATPSGIPVAIVAGSAVEQVEPRYRSLFAPLLERTLESLRKDTWWLSFEARRSYKAELTRWLNLAGVSTAEAPDSGLEELERAEKIIRSASTRSSPHLAFQDGRDSLILWSRTSQDAEAVGAILSGPALEGFLDAALRPVFEGQPFTAVLHQSDGRPLWNGLPGASGATAPWKTETLRAIPGLQLDFTGPEQSGTARNTWMGYGFVLLPMLMLAVGLVMTVRVIRQEVALNALQSKFIAAVSHELKSPLTGIRLLMERIAGGRLKAPEEIREYYAAIGRETDRLESLVSRLLESQAIQSERRKYDFAPASLSEIASSAIQRLRPQAEAKKIRLAAQVDDGVPELPLDKAAIGDAIENLLDNAIKYSPPESEVSIHIRSAGNEARVEVSDQGIGIEKSDIPRIFDPFYRGRRGDMESVKGTGLGLALVKAAAEAHGGAVEVASAPSQGSRFTLHLPIGARP
jgi:signal transduction histidine kinase